MISPSRSPTASLSSRWSAYAAVQPAWRPRRSSLANALEVSPSGGSIEIDVTPAKDHVVIRVRDEGPGLDEQDRERAFDRFWQGANHETGSSGLGLAIVKELVTAGGGHVALDGRDQGIDAIITLPSGSRGN